MSFSCQQIHVIPWRGHVCSCSLIPCFPPSGFFFHIEEGIYHNMFNIEKKLKDNIYFKRELLLFSGWLMSDCLWPHGLQHTRLFRPSPSPKVCSTSGPLSRRCHATISSSVAPFSSCPQSFPASGSFPMSRLFTSGGQSIGGSRKENCKCKVRITHVKSK